MRTDRAERLIMAPPELVYRALLDPAVVVEWLAPRGAHGSIGEFDARPGGAFCMTLTFDGSLPRGKSASNTDVAKERFVALEANRRVVQRFEFDSADPAFAGTMTMTWALAPQAEGTLVTITAENVPAGIGAEDHEAGMALSLSNLARVIEAGNRSPERLKNTLRRSR